MCTGNSASQASVLGYLLCSITRGARCLSPTIDPREGLGGGGGGRETAGRYVCLINETWPHAPFSLRLSGRQAAQSRAVPIVPCTRLRRLGYEGASADVSGSLAERASRGGLLAPPGRDGSACSVGVHGLLGGALLGRGRVGGDALRGVTGPGSQVG